MNKVMNLPRFGDILNQAIQLMKSDLAAKKAITSAAFHKFVDNGIQISDEQKKLEFLSNFDIDLDGKPTTNCYDELVGLVIDILDATGLIQNSCFNLISNYEHCTLKFIDINETITPEVFDKIDSDKRVCLWLITSEINEYRSTEFENGCHGDTDRIKRCLFKEYERLNQTAYANDLDPLLTHIIEKCTHTLNAILNNYDKPMSIKTSNSLSRTDIIDKINTLTPLKFEKYSLLVLSGVFEKDNLKANVSFEHTGKTADGGIDGTLSVKTRLKGTQEYCVQCKHYSKNIGVRAIREFSGTLAQNRNYHQGYFVTNSSFSNEAIKFAADQTNIVLINGESLVDLMIEYEIGIYKKDIEPILELDNSFFENI